ncbi:hypothetical protein Cgig2_031048 [Carnegiea gigantea]|uniref:Cullin family profile domain-containing protein n=1 Tax=Carnegiea gigantea TaxID=171969 RepID=A0A9Q1KD21_9CARY|nr:hypothetical protein Cgig2_031048 [Carnegiea gigantea]
MTEYKILSLEEGWAQMEKGITKLKRILEGLPETPFNSEEYMMLYTCDGGNSHTLKYRTIYNLCTQKPPHDYSEQLYKNYKQAIEDYINSMVLPALRDKHDEFMLKELVKRWLNHKIMIRWLSRFFHYLNRYFVTRRSLPVLNDVGLSCFRDLVYEEFHVKAKDSVLALIYAEREGAQIDRTLLKNVLDVSIEIGMGRLTYYESNFEEHFLSDTAAYYSTKASSWCEECLKKEKDRVTHYLHSSTEPKLVEEVQRELLLVHENQLLEKENSGCRALLREDKVGDLCRMYRLYNKATGGLEPIGNILKQHITEEGIALIQQAEEAANNKAENAGGSHEQVFVRNVIELHDKFMGYVNNCFEGHAVFQKALKEAFDIFLNKGVAGSSSAELLATFCDNILKKGGSEKLSDDAIEDSLEKMVKLLVFVSEKDLFAEFYRKKLSRRLLFDKSANDDHERSIISKLKQQCGGQFTSKMEGMVTDLTLAKENQASFEEYLAQNSNKNLGLSMSVQILTTGFWPSYKSSDLTLPVEMARGVEAFKEFYQTKTKHRKLTWVFSLGSCIVNGKFSQKTIELVLGTYQAATLLLFNTSDNLSYTEIGTTLNLADEDLTRVLQSLSCGKYKILNKEPKTKTVSSTDTFAFNASFTDKMRRIRIPLPQMDERKKVVEDVGKDRMFAIDAAIVRIMKSRKVLGYQQLITETVEQLSRMFKPDIKQIKKRIEDLITRDYLERDKENKQTFRYLA